jgi:hypothetical protein
MDFEESKLVIFESLSSHLKETMKNTNLDSQCPTEIRTQYLSFKSLEHCEQKKINSLAFSPREKNTDRATASCRRSQCQLLRLDECRMVSAANPYGCNLGSLDGSRYFFFQVAPQLYSQGWVDPVPDPLVLRKSSSAGNRTRAFWFVTRNSDH